MTRRRISPRLREQAAVACACMATWWTEPYADFEGPPLLPGCVVDDLAISAHAATRLRWPILPTNETFAEAWAEAEALLRTGWVP